MAERSTAVRVLLPALLTSLALISGSCDSPSATDSSAAPDFISLEEARSNNVSRIVAEQYRNSVQVLDDPYGIESVETFFDSSNTLVVADSTAAAQLRGASLAISQHAPMVTYDDSVHGAIIKLIDDLRIHRVVTIGDVGIASSTGEVIIFPDPGTDKSLGEMTAFEYSKQLVRTQTEMPFAVANLQPNGRVELRPEWEVLDIVESGRVPALPAQSRRDGQMAPVIVATPTTPVVNIVNARSFGGNVHILPDADPATNESAMAKVIGLADGPLIALGAEFESPTVLAQRIREGEEKFFSEKSTRPSE